MITIAKNRKKFIDEIFSNARCYEFTADNCYAATEVDPSVAREALRKHKSARLIDETKSHLDRKRFIVRVFKNRWYELYVEADTVEVRKNRIRLFGHEMTEALQTAVRRGKLLAELYEEANDFGCSRTFERFADKIERILECNHGIDGLVRFVSKCIEEAKK